MRRVTIVMSIAEPRGTHSVASDLGSEDDEEDYNPQHKTKYKEEADYGTWSALM